MSTKDKFFIIKLGGSIVAPKSLSGPDVTFLKSFQKFIIERVQNYGERFVINVGGGNPAREYQEALKQLLPNPSLDALDYLGIRAIQMNAELVMQCFKDVAYQKVCNTFDEIKDADFTKSIVIIGAEKPGHSSNMDAIFAAQITNGSTIINMSNVDYVYSADPRKNPNAEKFEIMSWNQYLKYIPETWDPGMSVPFDPEASKKAKDLGLTVVFMKGDDINNLRQYLETGFVAGTIIQPQPVSVAS